MVEDGNLQVAGGSLRFNFVFPSSAPAEQYSYFGSTSKPHYSPPINPIKKIFSYENS